jgi:tagatose 1,6-diphosphate aldolase GatY/KbaY
MSIVNAKEITVEAAKYKYAIGAFNITDLVEFQGIVDAAVELRSPVIIQTSVKPSRFLGADVLVSIYRTIATTAPVPICLHLDHCSEVVYCKRCAEAGYTSIMIDASRRSYADNIGQTREVVEHSHRVGDISVEGELCTASDVEAQIKAAGSEARLASPEAAVQFVEATGVDIFAPALGTAHETFKTRNPKIDFERLGVIYQLLNAGAVKTPLSVHGGSGLPGDQIRRLIELGAAKFGVSTELKHILIDAAYEYITANRDEYEPGKLDVAVRDAVRKASGHWMQVLGSMGKA